MKTRYVKEFMIPISEYASVHEDANIAEAIQAIESENKSYGEGPYRHHSLVVINDKQHVVGRLSQVDIMQALEPRYRNLDDAHWVSQSELSKETLITLRESFQLWEEPLEVMCKKLGNLKVKDYMQEPTEGEFVSKNDTCNIACHRIVMGRHHSLLVTRDKEIIGILRSTDLFNNFYDLMASCNYLES